MKYEGYCSCRSMSVCMIVSVRVSFHYVSNDNRNENTLLIIFILAISHQQTSLSVNARQCGFSLSCGLAEVICSMHTLQKVVLQGSSLVLHDAFYQRVAEKAASSKVSKSRTDINTAFGFTDDEWELAQCNIMGMLEKKNRTDIFHIVIDVIFIRCGMRSMQLMTT